MRPPRWTNMCHAIPKSKNSKNRGKNYGTRTRINEHSTYLIVLVVVAGKRDCWWRPHRWWRRLKRRSTRSCGSGGTGHHPHRLSREDIPPKPPTTAGADAAAPLDPAAVGAPAIIPADAAGKTLPPMPPATAGSTDKSITAPPLHLGNSPTKDRRRYPQVTPAEQLAIPSAWKSAPSMLHPPPCFPAVKRKIQAANRLFYPRTPMA